jgi:hypothetical protein
MENETKKALIISGLSLIGIYVIYKLFFTKKIKLKEIPKIDINDLKFISDETPKRLIGVKQEKYKDSKGVFYIKTT